MLRILFVTLLTSLLAACGVTPTTRADPSAYELVQRGQIPPLSTQLFTDCVMDGFDGAHRLQSDILVRQQRRVEAYRVEAFFTGYLLLLSADIFDNGRVELFRITTTTLIPTLELRKAFAGCLDRFHTTN